MNIFSLSQEHFDFDFDSDSFLFADKIATEQYEYNDSFRKNEQIFYAIEEATETSSALESIRNILSNNKIENKHEVKAINFALEHLARQIGFKPKSYSLESYKNGVALEGIVTFIKTIWDAIISAVKKIGENIVKFFKWITGSGASTGAHCSETIKVIKETKKDQMELTPESREEIEKYNKTKENLESKIKEMDKEIEEEEKQVSEINKKFKEDAEKARKERDHKREELLEKIGVICDNYKKKIDGIREEINKLKGSVKDGPTSRVVSIVDEKTINDLDKHVKVLDLIFQKHVTRDNICTINQLGRELFENILSIDFSEKIRAEYPHIVNTMAEEYGLRNTRNIRAEVTMFWAVENTSKWIDPQISGAKEFYDLVSLGGESFLTRNTGSISLLNKCSKIELEPHKARFQSHSFSINNLDTLLAISEVIKNDLNGDNIKRYQLISKELCELCDDMKEMAIFIREKYNDQSEEDLSKISKGYQEWISAVFNQFPIFVTKILHTTKEISDETMSVIDFCVKNIKVSIKVKKLEEEVRSLRSEREKECKALENEQIT